MKRIYAWERAWRLTWIDAYRSGAGSLSNASSISIKRTKAANDDKYFIEV